MVIIVSGKQGSGKTTTTERLVEHYDGHHIKFADPLYSVHEAMWDVLEGYGVPREKKSGDFLQYLGTEFGRKRDANMWVNIAKYRIKQILEQDPHAVIVVDDCRFENEFSALDEFNPIKVRLECDRDVRKGRADAWRDNEFHTSETALDAISADGQFDLYFDTEEQDIDTVVASIQAAVQDIETFGDMQRSPTTFTHLTNKYFDKGFKKLEDGRNVGTW